MLQHKKKQQLKLQKKLLTYILPTEGGKKNNLYITPWHIKFKRRLSTQADGQTHSCENDCTADVWGRTSKKETTLSQCTSLDERCTHGEMGVWILLKLELAKFPGGPVTSHIVSVVFQQYLYILHYILPISSSGPVITLYGDSEFSQRQNREFLILRVTVFLQTTA